MNLETSLINEETIKRIKRNNKKNNSSFIVYTALSKKNKKYNKYNSNFIKTENSYNSFIREKVDDFSKQNSESKVKKKNSQTGLNFIDCFLNNSPLNKKEKKTTNSFLLVPKKNVSDNSQAKKLIDTYSTINQEIVLKPLDVERQLIKKIDKLDPRNLNRQIKQREKAIMHIENKNTTVTMSNTKPILNIPIDRFYSPQNKNRTKLGSSLEEKDSFDNKFERLIEKLKLNSSYLKSYNSAIRTNSLFKDKLIYHFQNSKECAYNLLKDNPYFESKELQKVKQIKTVYKFFGSRDQMSFNYTPTIGGKTAYEEEYKFTKLQDEAFALISVFNSIKTSTYANFFLLEEEVIQRINDHINLCKRNDLIKDVFRRELANSELIINKFSDLVKYYENESKNFVELFKKSTMEIQALKKNAIGDKAIANFFTSLTALDSELQHRSDKFWKDLEKLKILIIKYIKY